MSNSTFTKTLEQYINNYMKQYKKEHINFVNVKKYLFHDEFRKTLQEWNENEINNYTDDLIRHIKYEEFNMYDRYTDFIPETIQLINKISEISDKYKLLEKLYLFLFEKYPTIECCNMYLNNRIDIKLVNNINKFDKNLYHGSGELRNSFITVYEDPDEDRQAERNWEPIEIKFVVPHTEDKPRKNDYSTLEEYNRDYEKYVNALNENKKLNQEFSNNAKKLFLIYIETKFGEDAIINHELLEEVKNEVTEFAITLYTANNNALIYGKDLSLVDINEYKNCSPDDQRDLLLNEFLGKSVDTLLMNKQLINKISQDFLQEQKNGEIRVLQDKTIKCEVVEVFREYDHFDYSLDQNADKMMLNADFKYSQNFLFFHPSHITNPCDSNIKFYHSLHLEEVLDHPNQGSSLSDNFIKESIINKYSGETIEIKDKDEILNIPVEELEFLHLKKLIIENKNIFQRGINSNMIINQLESNLDMLNSLELTYETEKEEQVNYKRKNELSLDILNNINGILEKAKNLKVLQLKNLYFTDLPKEIINLTLLTHLNLVDNILSSLPSEIGNLTHLTLLDLSDNDLTQLPPEIGNLTSLIELNLDNNKLNNLPPEIGKLIQLTKLQININQLTELPIEIGNLTHLTELYLFFNKLSELPPTIVKLKNLTRLYIEGNKLTNLPSEFRNLTHLKEFGLGNNCIVELPPQIGHLTELTKLDISDIELSPEITNLTNLRYLYYRGNSLMELPLLLTKLTHLTHLNMNSNHLSKLPPEIGNLCNLEELNLETNELKNLPPEIGNLTQLTVLNLKKNNLMKLPSEIGKLIHLKELNLQENKLTELPPEMGKLIHLNKLLVDDHLSVIKYHPNKNFFSNEDLLFLDLSRKDLKYIPYDIFILPNLEILNISFNDLTEIPLSLSRLTKLAEIDMQHNKKLSTFPDFIWKLPHLRDITLNGYLLSTLSEEVWSSRSVQVNPLIFYDDNDNDNDKTNKKNKYDECILKLITYSRYNISLSNRELCSIFDICYIHIYN